MAQGPMPERARPSRGPSWPDDGLSISNGGGDDDSCCRGDIRDGNSVDHGIGNDGDGSVDEGSDGSDLDGIVCHSRYQR